MDKRLKAKWLKALRSGEYAQGKGKLCTLGDDRDYFCCLGVLYDVAEGAWVSLIEVAATRDGDTGEWGRDHLTMDQIGRLVDMNDGEGRYKRPLTFKQIANWIERNL